MGLGGKGFAEAVSLQFAGVPRVVGGEKVKIIDIYMVLVLAADRVFVLFLIEVWCGDAAVKALIMTGYCRYVVEVVRIECGRSRP